MTQRFQRAYDALVDAFFNGTLAKGTCAACAVGNIVGASIGVKVSRTDSSHGSPQSFWHALFCTGIAGQRIRNEGASEIFKSPEEVLDVISKRLTKLTGYLESELALVELVFERATAINFRDYDFHT